MDIMHFIQDQLTDDVINNVQRRIGADSKEQTHAAVNGAVSSLLAAMSKNAAKPGGASALVSALDRDHDGSVFNDLSGFLGGHSQPVSGKAADGVGILNHVLGNQQSGVMKVLAKMTGLDKSKVGNLLVTVAPMVMGALGKAKRQNNIDSNRMSDFLSHNVRSAAKRNQGMDLISRFIDQDDDGSIIDDIAGMGIKALFGRK